MLYNTMNKYIPRFVAVLLAVSLAFGSAVSVFATEDIPAADENIGEEANAEVTENASSEVEEPETERITSGFCGAGLSWSFSGGTLTITGSGSMTNFSESTMAPWYGIREEILNVVLPEGLFSIGNLAFYDCENIVSVVIPSSVETIGNYAFANCNGMEMLVIGSRVKTIGKAAFSDCYKLKSISLPNSLISIGIKGFYRCESITSVTVPSSVTSIGVSAFAYCKSLVTANIQASITILPEYMFYGCGILSSVSLPETMENVSKFSFSECESLNSVYYSGLAKTPEEIQNDIESNSPESGNIGFVGTENPGGAVSSGSVSEQEDGTHTQETITVTPGTNSSVSTTVKSDIDAEEGLNPSGAEIIVNVNGENGWDEAKDVLEKELDRVSGNTSNISLNIYVAGTEEINSEFINLIAGKNVSVTIMTQDGSVWKINGSQLDAANLSGAYNLAYELSFGEAELSEELGTGISFVLRFLAPAEVNAEVLIRIGPAYARQNATLFQRDGELKRLQSVVVDSEGYAHFYLASVTEETEYYIAMNLPDAQQEAIIPENMLAEYGTPEYTEPIRYEITGRTSSWGMNLGQVMGILAAVMVTVIVVVGVTMFVLNKKKLRAGYVPQWEDEEE